MKTGSIIYLLTALMLVASSCVTSFTPEIDEYDNIIVVEGLLTDENVSNYVKLSRTIPVGITGLNSPLVDAHVYVKDEFNNVAIFNERKPGYYCSDSLTFRGIAGRTYTLHMRINGDDYESDPMLLKPVAPIDSLYSTFEYFYDGSTYPPLYAYDIYFDSYDPDNNNRFFRWTYEEVWEYHLPWHYPTAPKDVCWLTRKSERIMIKNNSNVEEAIIREFPLLRVDNRSSSRLFQAYSINLKQYSINESEYTFWESMKKMTDEQGGLYDPVPTALTGNVHSVDNPDEPVLGFFSVSGVSSRRLFIRNDTIKYLPGGLYCVTDTIDKIENISGLGRYVFILEEIDSVGFLVTTFENCADCRLSGTPIKPDFWPY